MLLLLILSRQRSENLKGEVFSPRTVPNPLKVLIRMALVFFLPTSRRLYFSYKSEVHTQRVIQGGTVLLHWVFLLCLKSFQDLVLPTSEIAKRVNSALDELHHKYLLLKSYIQMKNHKLSIIYIIVF